MRGASARFSVRKAGASESPIPSRALKLKRRERRAPADNLQMDQVHEKVFSNFDFRVHFPWRPRL